MATDTDSSEVATRTPTVAEPIELTVSSDTVAPETGGFFAGVGHFPPIGPATSHRTEASQPLIDMTSDQQTCLRCSHDLFSGHAQNDSILM